jgi:hypothetical protein
MRAKALIRVWGKPRPRVWRVIFEGTVDEKSFIQNVWVTATTRSDAISAARTRFDEFEANFVKVSEAKPTKDATLQDGETQVSGRIFFG